MTTAARPLKKSVKRKIRYHVQSWPASRLPGFPAASLLDPGIVVSLVIPYSSPFFRKKIPEKVVKNIREKSGKNLEKS